MDGFIENDRNSLQSSQRPIWTNTAHHLEQMWEKQSFTPPEIHVALCSHEGTLAGDLSWGAGDYVTVYLANDDCTGPAGINLATGEFGTLEDYPELSLEKLRFSGLSG